MNQKSDFIVGCLNLPILRDINNLGSTHSRTLLDPAMISSLDNYNNYKFKT